MAAGRKRTPHKDPSIELHGSLWMTVGGESLGGTGRIELLAKIRECGSITHAAKAVGMSYKAAWDAIEAMNNLAGTPLVERAAGGAGGGGSRLTPRGERLVRNFHVIEREHRRFVDQLRRDSASLADDFRLIRRMSMKSSARNQYLGRVRELRRGAVNDEIDLDLAGGQQLVAVVTHESAASLDLRVGAEVFALIKASSVILVTDVAGARFSARNQLAGTVSRLQRGAVNTEVVMELPGGGAIAAVITNESATALGLAIGQSATALVKASSVILGAPA